ncbi:BCCT family transporter [Xylanibacter rodentium]|nr:BCCT family transporter [Xylanibacter rodentium]
MLILLPIALLFAENTLYSLQGVTIIAAFPVGILLVLIVWAFFKDCSNFIKNNNHGQ